jgi:RNA-binding protein
MVGQHGWSESVLAELESTMNKHELLKIKIRVDGKDEKQQMIDQIVKVSRSNLVQVIGNVMVIYRAFDEEPQIILPRK